MTKNLEREQARKLRLEQGMSVKEIAKALGVAKSSVSMWVRDIELTPEQIRVIQERVKNHDSQLRGSRAVIDKHLKLRQQYQSEGREKAREGNLLHSQGCMLYWAEGSKSRNEIQFVNADAGMMIHFVKFLREALKIPEEKITFRVYCYLGNDLTLEEIESYWLAALQLERFQMRRGSINNQPVSSQQKGRQLLYGVCHLSVNSTQHLQHIYGAIQEYTGIDKPEWLD
jgi:predicted transcriptional regulator